MEEQNNKWTLEGFFKKFFSFLWIAFVSLIRGSFVAKMKLHLYFKHFLFAFFLCFVWISSTYIIELNLIKVEDNKKIIKRLETEQAQKNIHLESLHKQSDILEKLQRQGSKLNYPDKPHYRIKD